MKKAFSNILIKYIRLIKVKHIIFMILCGVVFSSVFLILQKNIIKDKYMARTTLAVMVRNKKSGYAILATSHYLADSFSSAYNNNKVAQYTIDKLDSGLTKEEILSRIDVKRKEKTVLVKVNAIESTPTKAKLLSKTFAEGMALYIGEPFGLNSIIVVEEPDQVIRISKSRDAILIGFAVGISLGALYVYIKHLSDNKVRASNIKNKLDIPYMGIVYLDSKRGKRDENYLD